MTHNWRIRRCHLRNRGEADIKLTQALMTANIGQIPGCAEDGANRVGATGDGNRTRTVSWEAHDILARGYVKSGLDVRVSASECRRQ
jgi:hypothetical protein